MKSKIIALAGNPNVGKSTVFNSLTGLNQHTGNWPGKTVTHAQGNFSYKDTDFLLMDLPGIYSLTAISPDEAAARDYICSGKADLVLIVADGTCLERNLNLVLQILSITKNAVLCVNLLDEARKKGISIDLPRLSAMLGIPAVGISARSGEGRKELLDTLLSSAENGDPPSPECFSRDCFLCTEKSPSPEAAEAVSWVQEAHRIYESCVRHKTADPHRFDRRLDEIVTSKRWGRPLMLLLLAVIFWITITGANYPSQWLSSFFARADEQLRQLPVPPALEGPVMDGIYKTTAWVVAVMLPPMAIFFPLFTLLEDFGYLPRIAFNLDHIFCKCAAHGKQALTTRPGDFRMPKE